MSEQPRNRLESWKEIGAYLQRDARTVRRWEKEEGLPVHRHSHRTGNSVYAYPSEIDTWRASRKAVPEPAPVRVLWRWPAFALTMLLCLIMVGNGVRPVAAQQAAKAARQVWVNQPSAWPDSLSPDGRYFSFQDWKTGGNLAVHDITTGINRSLTSDGEAESSRFSPDGREIAYIGSWEVRLVPAAGGQPRTVRKKSGDYTPPIAWSPDGKQLLLNRELPDHTGQLALLSLRDGSLRSLKSYGWWRNINAAFSPDGRWIAYDASPDRETQATDIFLLSADGNREIALVQNPAADSAPVWSADGSRIFFLSNRTGSQALWTVSFVDGKPGKEELVKADLSGARRIFLAPSGTLYYLRPGEGGSNIYSAELSADMKVSSEPVLAVDTFVNSNSGPALSSDGEFLAYRSPRTGSSLVIRTLKTGEERVVPTQVPLANAFGIGPRWFPDGRSLLILSNIPQGPGPNFYSIDVATGKADLLLHSRGVSDFKISPDGKAIFYIYGERDRLVRFDLDTRRETDLKKDESFYDVSVSPDGKQLAYLVFAGTAVGGPSYIAVMPAAGGPSREIFRAAPWDDGSRLNTLAWTPDGRYLLFSKHGATEKGPAVLWRVPVVGGPAEQMGLSRPGLNSPQIHPSGRRIFFVANDSGPNEVWALENFLPAAGR